MAIKIDYDKCCFKDGRCQSCSCGGACSGCVEACAVGALKRDKILEVDNDKCLSCGVCIPACKYGALSLM